MLIGLLKNVGKMNAIGASSNTEEQFLTGVVCLLPIVSKYAVKFRKVATYIGMVALSLINLARQGKIFVAFIAINICLCSQIPEQQYLDHLNQFQGNKILLLGSWSAQERAAWNRLLDEENLFELDITIIDTTTRNTGTWSVDPSALEGWVRGRYQCWNSRWVFLDGQNQALIHEKIVLDSDELASRLEKAGLVNPVKQLREFLQLHPDHLEARADLLVKLRRRAIKLTTQKLYDSRSEGITQSSDVPLRASELEQLDPEADLLFWGSFAQEVDVTFSGSWHGIIIPFFRVEETGQIEKYSPTMKAVFTRHISKLETALHEVPNSQSLWDIWAWMARGLEKRDWKKLLSNLNAFTYPGSLPNPAPNVAVWLVREAKFNNDWEQVVELARTGVHFLGYHGRKRAVWFPGGWMADSSNENLDGYPLDSAYTPMLEGLLKLNRLDEANTVFEDILFFGGERYRGILVDLARQCNHPAVGLSWQTYSVETTVPRLPDISILGKPTLVRNYYGESPSLQYAKISFKNVRKDVATSIFGWPEDEEWWALLDKCNRLVVEGKGVLQYEIISEALERIGHRSGGEQARSFLRDQGSSSYAHYVSAAELVIDALLRSGGGALNNFEAKVLDVGLDHDLYSQCAQNWLSYYENEQALSCLVAASTTPIGEYFVNWATNSDLLKAAAKKILPLLEKALVQQPMSEYLWEAWIRWRNVEGNVRPFAPLLERLAPSPLVPPGSFPLPIVMDIYYSECISQERWSEAAKVLLQSWERDLAQIDATIKRNGAMSRFNPQTWITGKLLISAYLYDGKQFEAENVIEAWTSRGGQFRNASDIIELATKLNYRSLADKWEKMMNNR